MSNSIAASFSQTANGTSGWSTGGLGGLEFLIPGLGTNINKQGNPLNGVSLGGGFKGRMPQPVIGHDNSNSFSQTRMTLRQAWNTNKYSGQSSLKNTRIITPFRAVNNAGDVLSRQDYSCGGTCQTPQSKPNIYGLSQRFGSTQKTCVPSAFYSPLQLQIDIPASTCNVKYVYDGSDYTTYLKQRAMNKNYNDRSFGGNQYSGAQSATRAIRRY